MTWLMIIVLGAVGAAVRFLVAGRLPPLLGIAVVNTGAAFVLGLSSALDGPAAVGLQVGLLGAVSTWSTLAHQVAELLALGRWRRAVTYLGGSLVLGVSAAWIGLTLA